MAKNKPPMGAILQRDKETYAIVPRIPAGLISKEKLRNIADVVEKHNIPIVKITSGQRIALVGMKEDEIPAIYKDLEMEPGRATELCLHYVQACPGTQICSFGVQDSLGLGIILEDILSKLDMPAKLKIGVSGCPFSCAEQLVRDLGIQGKRGGWILSFGGNSGRMARIADVIADNLDDNQVIELAQKCLKYYAENAKKKERASKFIERIGVDEFMNNIGLV
ncbi:MAG: NAD(P)/FAD-dependent oxidoreductase [Desulfotalea sp.]